jgi:dihydrofolate reductase
MGQIVVTESVTLDGVMQAPAGADEDPRGGFAYGGWAAPYPDQVMGAEMAKGMARPGVMLFGRRTYESMAAHWPHQTDGNPFTEKLNKVQKYVVSSTMTEPLSWMNSTLVTGDVPRAVAALKADVDGDIAVLGSHQLVRTLAGAGLVDRYVLLIHPLVLGTGLRFFDTAGFSRLRLVESVPTGTGVIIATYEPED